MITIFSEKNKEIRIIDKFKYCFHKMWGIGVFFSKIQNFPPEMWADWLK